MLIRIREPGETGSLIPSWIHRFRHHSMEFPWNFHGKSVDILWIFHGPNAKIRLANLNSPSHVHGFPMEFPWNFHGIPTEFPRIQRIPDGSRGSISPCSPRGTTKLTFSSRVSWG